MSGPVMAGGPAQLALEFDDIVYSLQSFGGISEYWREVTGRVAQRPDMAVQRRSGTRWGRMRRLRSACRVFHSSYYRTARGPATVTVSTVHDLAYELGHLGHGLAARLHCLEHRRAYFASDALICISHSTRRDLLQVYPELAKRCSISVVPHGVSLADEAAALPATGPAPLPSPYVLFVGGRGAYKNFGLALQGLQASGLHRQGLVLACTGAPLTADESRLVQRLGLQHAVHPLGQVSRQQLAGLYRGAQGLLYPSLFEGFGLPVLEAMAMGCPVIAANASALPEVAGDAALLVDARDAGAIAKALHALGDARTRQALVSAGHARAQLFSWQRSAQAHARIYQQLA